MGFFLIDVQRASFHDYLGLSGQLIKRYKFLDGIREFYLVVGQKWGSRLYSIRVDQDISCRELLFQFGLNHLS